MKPETIRKLQESVPELKELIAFLAEQVRSLDTLDGLAALSYTERAHEVTARLRAKETLERMLSPLISVQRFSTGIDPKEYVVE